jgi:plastocyanin
MRYSRFAPWLVSWFALAAFPASATNFNVVVGPDGDFRFDPPHVTINVGDSVTWQSAGGGGAHTHNVVANNGSFRCAAGCDGEGGSGTPSGAPWSFTRTFNTPGTVDYNCELHKSLGMTGSVIVNAASTFAIGPGITGLWYDPQQSGHGIFLEVLPDNRLLAWWFAFSPDGTQQSWFGGVGTYSGNTAAIPGVALTTGGRWIPNFDPTKIANNPWGTLNLTFTGCSTGRVDFISTYPGYGSNHMDLTRLTMPIGLTCP